MPASQAFFSRREDAKYATAIPLDDHDLKYLSMLFKKLDRDHSGVISREVPTASNTINTHSPNCPTVSTAEALFLDVQDLEFVMFYRSDLGDVLEQLR